MPEAEKSGVHYHRDMTVYTYARKNGKPLYVEKEEVATYHSYSSYAERTDNPVPMLNIPFLPKSRLHESVNKTIWFEPDTDDYFDITVRVLKVREIRNNRVVHETFIPFTGCTLHEPLTAENNWGQFLHCHVYLNSYIDPSYSRYKKARSRKTRLKNRYLSTQETKTLARQFNSNGYDVDEDDFYATDYVKRNRHDWF